MLLPKADPRIGCRESDLTRAGKLCMLRRSPEHCPRAEAVVLLEDSKVAPQVWAVCNSREPPLVGLYSACDGSMALLSISILLPVPKAERILLEEGIIHLAYPCDVSLRGHISAHHGSGQAASSGGSMTSRKQSAVTRLKRGCLVRRTTRGVPDKTVHMHFARLSSASHRSLSQALHSCQQ